MEIIKLAPFLFIIYFLVELFEHKYGDSLKHKLQKIGALGPVVGSLFGALPQCGFSVIATSLFLSGYLSIGTLISVYLSTSDEALPILLADPSKSSFILPLIIIKIIYATLVGFTIDLILPKLRHKKQTVSVDVACCGHHPDNEKLSLKELFVHPLIHTLKLLLFIVGITYLLDILFLYFHPVNFLNPFSSALFGLFPNCAASVFITELFIKNAISFGTLLSGLCASAGLGLLVLFKENKNKLQSFSVLLILYVFSVLIGLIIK